MATTIANKAMTAQAETITRQVGKDWPPILRRASVRGLDHPAFFDPFDKKIPARDQIGEPGERGQKRTRNGCHAGDLGTLAREQC